MVPYRIMNTLGKTVEIGKARGFESMNERSSNARNEFDAPFKLEP